MNCPHCNKHIDDKLIARRLASKGGSAAKNYSEIEKQKRRDRLAKAREKRWSKKEVK